MRLVFVLTDDAETRRLWPHAFRLELEMHLGRALRLALRAWNTGPDPVTVTGALHTYLAVGDVREVSIAGLEGAEYLDTTVTPPVVQQQQGRVVFTGEVDRNYLSSAAVAVTDAAAPEPRGLTVRGEGSGCTVVWNPWTAKARALADLPDEDYLRFVCVETANAWRDTLVIPPGASHTLATEVHPQA